MSTHEGFKVLSRGEYDGRRDARIIEHDINQGQIYTAMFSLDSMEAEAASNPVSVAEKRVCLRCGKLALLFAVLNQQLKPIPKFTKDGHIEDGLWLPAQDFRFSAPVQGAVTELYLADYDDGIPWDLFTAVDRTEELVGSGSATH